MKRILLLASSALLLLAGCAKEVTGPKAGDGTLQELSFTANLADEATKATIDNDGNAASVNRCIMEVYYGSDLFTRMYAPVNDQKKASFTVSLVSNRTYKVAFWADHVDAAGDSITEAELSSDKYYTTNAAGGLQAVALKGTYAGNLDERDAFWHCGDYTVKQGGTNFDVTLKRPFAQVNVITTDVQTIKPVPALVPTGVDVTVKNAYTSINLLTGGLSGETTLNYTAGIYNFPAEIGDKTEATLSMDYLFATSEKGVIDIDWKATKTGDNPVSHSFTNIPYQRNYRTNIKGALLTATGKWNVTVDPIWESDKPGAQEIIYEVVNDIAGANTVIENEIASGKTEISVKFTSEPNDAGTPGTTSGDITSKAIVTTGLPEDAKLNILVEAQTKDLYIGDYQSETNTTVVTAGTKAAVVNLNIPTTSGIKKLVVNAPSKTVYLNGIQVASAGVIEDLDAIVSQSTLVIEEGQTVDKLTIRQGGLEIHGEVQALVIDENAHDTNPVKVRKCENLSAEVFAVIKGSTPSVHNYIDTPYFVEKDNGDGTWDIVQAEAVAKIGSKNYYVLQTAFDEVADGQTIELLVDHTQNIGVQFNKNITATFDLKGNTLKVTGSTSSIDGGRAIKVVSGKLTVKNGTIDGRSVNPDGSPKDNPSSSGPWSSTRTGGCVRANGGDVVLEDLVMYNNDGWGNAIKLESANTVEIRNCIVNSVYGGCMEIGTGTANVYGSTFNQSKKAESPSLSSCLAAAYEGTINVYADPATSATGTYPIYVCNSCGTVNIDGGTYTAVGTDGIAAWADGTIYSKASAVSTVNLNGGAFAGSLRVEQSEGDSAFINLYGGIYSVEPASTDATIGFGFKQTSNPDPQTSSAYPWMVAGTPVADADVSITKTGMPTGYATLAEFRDATNAGNSFAGYTITLLKDIDLNNEEWTPVSNYAYGKGAGRLFAGTFDGGNHTISNMKIANNTQDALGNTSDLANAFFGQVTTCTVRNLKFANANVSGAGLNAIVVSLHTVSTGKLLMDNVQVLSGSVTNSDNAGGLACFFTGWSGFSNCTNYASVSGYGVGGIIGMLRDNTASNTCTISDCVNYGTITNTVGGGDGAGGIVSKINNSGSISNCRNYGVVTGTVSNVYSGGIIGVANPNSKSFNISNCINYADISSNAGQYGRAGGIIGSFGGSLTISKCINTGNVTGYQGAGGIDGYCGDSWGLTVNHSYNSGSINATQGHAGGIDQGNINQTVSCSLNSASVSCGSGCKAVQISNSSSTINSSYYYDGATLKENSGTVVTDLNAALTALNSGLSTPFWAKDGNNVIKPVVLIQ